jgi:CCR4-NOT transcription complex subunit 1
MNQELAVTHSLISEQIVAPGGLSQHSHISYLPIDSYSKLVSMVLKVSLRTFSTQVPCYFGI